MSDTPTSRKRDAENAALRRGVRNGYGLMTDHGVVRASIAEAHDRAVARRRAGV